ncbi:hypothetical protein DFH06DRAFT_1340612 [Mycena polygramma]|nr:hypothetical protein DFH06DRAFT_1340612 [Mycena polygramma]
MRMLLDDTVNASKPQYSLATAYATTASIGRSFASPGAAHLRRLQLFIAAAVPTTGVTPSTSRLPACSRSPAQLPDRHAGGLDRRQHHSDIMRSPYTFVPRSPIDNLYCQRLPDSQHLLLVDCILRTTRARILSRMGKSTRVPRSIAVPPQLLRPRPPVSGSRTIAYPRHSRIARAPRIPQRRPASVVFRRPQATELYLTSDFSSNWVSRRRRASVNHNSQSSSVVLSAVSQGMDARRCWTVFLRTCAAHEYPKDSASKPIVGSR